MMNLLIQFTLFLVGLVAFSSVGTAQEIFSYGGKSYASKDLPILAQQELAELEMKHYHDKNAIIHREMLQMYFAEYAKAKKITVEEAEAQILQVDEPTEKEIKAFYEDNKDHIAYRFEQVKDELKTYIAREQKEEKRQAVLNRVAREKKFKLAYPAPSFPTVDLNVAEFHSRGADKAKLHIVEFADFQCPHCKHASDAFKEIWDSYKGKVKFTFVDFPVNPSGISKKISEGGYCAAKQDKYWDYHYLAFASQAKLMPSSPLQFAKELKLDEEKFSACFTSKEAREFVERGLAEGKRLSVLATPTFYFNGRRAKIGHDAATLRREIDQALKAASS